MASKKKLLQAAAGSAGGAGLDVDEVFSTYLYEGNGSSQTITNGIDLSGEGGLVWIKNRDSAENHGLVDTEVDGLLFSNLTNAANTGIAHTFNSNGFTVGSAGAMNDSGDSHVSWTFRKAPKFFDVVTYTGNATARTISHNLGTTVGTIVIKDLVYGNWRVFHRSVGNTKYLELNTTSAQATDANIWNNTDPTDSVFTIGSDGSVNESGRGYVAYLFAHNNSNGEFGPTQDQDIIKCADFTTDGSENATVTLGFEPQWVLWKPTATSSNWKMFDAMRGMPVGGNDALLEPDGSGAETAGVPYISPTPTGFNVTNMGASQNVIFMAIRRGPLAEPESATDVFDVEIGGSSVADNALATTTGFPVDMFMHHDNYSGGGETFVVDRLRGRSSQVRTQVTNAEGTYSTNNPSLDSNSGLINRAGSTKNLSGGVYWHWKRAPGFFDVVAYTGTGSSSARAVPHNLGVVPEMMWVKQRATNGGEGWAVYHKDLNGGTDPEDYYLSLNTNNGEANNFYRWADTAPTATNFYVTNDLDRSGGAIIAYLFATVSGVSKVGSYTGNGGTQNIDCGFSSGARFVFTKRTDTTGSWHIFDTARGIVSGNDPVLQFNNTQPENSNDDYIDPHSSGFSVASTSLTNASGGTYIFYAIA